jgi:hypothetical protein
MRPTLLLPPGVRPKIPEILKNPIPKKRDPWMDVPLTVKNEKDAVVFKGTPRQWQAWAGKREAQRRASFGLPPKKKGVALRTPSYR